MAGLSKEIEFAPQKSLVEKLSCYLSSNNIFTVDELVEVLDTDAATVRATIHRIKQTGIRVEHLRRRNGTKIYFRIPEQEEDRIGYFIRQIPQLRKYSLRCPPRPRIRDRIQLLLDLGVVEEGSLVANTLELLSDGLPKTMAAIAYASRRDTLNMPVTLRRCDSILPLFGLRIEAKPSMNFEPNRKKGQAQKEYQLLTMVEGNELEQYFLEFREQLLSVARSIVKDEAEAEEVVSKVQLIMLEKNIDGSLPPELNIPAYVIQSVRNRALNVWSRTKDHDRLKGKNAESIAPRDFALDPESAAIESDRQRQVLGYLSGLSPNHQEILMLFYYDGLSTEQIAVKLEIEAGTVASRMSRAREALKRALSTHGVLSAMDL